MSKYAVGRRVEWDVRKELEAHPLTEYVVRSAGSKGVADLVAFVRGSVLFIQCKVRGLPSLREREDLIKKAYVCGAWPVVAYRDKGLRYVWLPDGEIHTLNGLLAML